MRQLLIFLILFSVSTTLLGKVIAISYFDNNSEIVKFNPLAKGIADMLITDLSKVNGVIIVERSKLDQIIKEINLQGSKYFNQQTAVKLGKGLGADYILTGSFTIVGNMIRIDARLINVNNGTVEFSEEASGEQKDFFSIHKKLAGLLGKSMSFEYSNRTSYYSKNQKAISLDALSDYSNAIDLSDKGLKELSANLLKNASKKESGFLFADDKIKELNSWLSSKQREYDSLMTLNRNSLVSGLNFDNPDELLINKVLQIIRDNGIKYALNSLFLCRKLELLKVDYKQTPYKDLYFEIEANKFYCYTFLKQYDSALITGKKLIEQSSDIKSISNNWWYSEITDEMKGILNTQLNEEQHRKNIGNKLLKMKLIVLEDFIKRFNSDDYEKGQISLPYGMNQISYSITINTNQYQKLIKNFISEADGIDNKKLNLNLTEESSGEYEPVWKYYYDAMKVAFELASKYNDVNTMKKIQKYLQESIASINDLHDESFENWSGQRYIEDNMNQILDQIKNAEGIMLKMNEWKVFYSYEKLTGEYAESNQSSFSSLSKFPSKFENWKNYSLMENDFFLNTYKSLASSYHLCDLDDWKSFLCLIHFREGADSSSYYLNKLKNDSSYFSNKASEYIQLIKKIKNDFLKLDKLKKIEENQMVFDSNYYSFLMAKSKSALYMTEELKKEEMAQIEELLQYNTEPKFVWEQMQRLKDLYIETGNFGNAKITLQYLIDASLDNNFQENFKKELYELPVL